MFTKDMLIGEILLVSPKAVEVLIEMGMHCLGCPSSQMESLEDACLMHGLDITHVLEKLNHLV